MTDYDSMIAVLQHAKAGGKVEWKWKAVGEAWHTTTPDGLMWDFRECEYRIAVEPPKPKECWLVFEECGTMDVFPCKVSAIRFAKCGKLSHGYCRMQQVGEYVRVSRG